MISIFDSFLDGVLVLDDQGRILYANPAMALVNDCARTQLKQGTVASLALSLSDPTVLDPHRDQLDPESQARSQELTLITRSKQSRTVVVSAFFFRDPQLPEAKRVVTIRDVSMDETLQSKYQAQIAAKETALLELKKINEDLEAKAREANAARASLLDTMGHELRSPISAVVSAIRLLSGTTLSGEQEEYLSALRVASNQLLETANDVLDHSKIDSGGIRLEVSSFPLLEPVGELMALFGPLAEEKGIVLKLTTSPGLPKLVMGDRRRLKQILNNLLANAIKFTSEGSVVIQIAWLYRSEERTRVRFSVFDSGPGLDPDEQKSLFVSYQQSKFNRDGGGSWPGTGLGLVISQKLAKLMGTEIQVKSEIGRGACFQFDLAFENSGSAEASYDPART